MSVRAFPAPASMLARAVVGTCKWCGRADVPKPKLYWHATCFDEYALHTRLDAQYAYLVRRDGEVCGICGQKPERWVPSPLYHLVRRGYMRDADWADEMWSQPTDWPRVDQMTAQQLEERAILGAYVQIDRRVALEVDHVTPLWSVAHLPPDERRRYFGPDNLWLLCQRHHRWKSKREARERAEART